ncbi:hypothetical protein V491_07896 [Pseudogymnoascus sp. VKM F-3775]|nr:hypothetical protein V491_07896 [Pseudogymnoascus sp. VKM F-3775]
MSANTVYVKNISGATSKKEVTDFFSFCGKIKSLELTPSGETQNAEVVFEKETAAKTALLLDNTQLGKTQVSVSGAEGAKEFDEAHREKDSDEITQEEKPRSRIIAEYLAHGYVIGDQASQRALDLDHKHGISNRFLQTLQNLDSKTKATEKAKSADQAYGLSTKAQGLFHSLTSYYEKAAGTPTGKKVVNFYSQTQKQVEDIHREARRLADLKKQEAATSTCKCGSDSSICTCAPGTCDCAGCAKSGKSTKAVPVPGTDKTTCSCGGDNEVCSCEVGKCACASCPKAPRSKAETSSGSSEKTTCGCGGDSKSCSCPEGKCACSGSASAPAPAPASDAATSQTAPLDSTTTQPLDSTTKQ